MTDVAAPLPSNPMSIGAFCASDPDDHAAAAPLLSTPRNSRRLTCDPSNLCGHHNTAYEPTGSVSEVGMSANGSRVGSRRGSGFE